MRERGRFFAKREAPDLYSPLITRKYLCPQIKNDHPKRRNGVKDNVELIIERETAKKLRQEIICCHSIWQPLQVYDKQSVAACSYSCPNHAETCFADAGKRNEKRVAGLN
jgi:hypothetical protein